MTNNQIIVDDNTYQAWFYDIFVANGIARQPVKRSQEYINYLNSSGFAKNAIIIYKILGACDQSIQSNTIANLENALKNISKIAFLPTLNQVITKNNFIKIDFEECCNFVIKFCIENGFTNWNLDNIVILNSALSTTIGKKLNEYDCFNTSKLQANSNDYEIDGTKFVKLKNKNLTEFIIPNRITEICNYAFNGCINLTSIIIPDTVTFIGTHAFTGCGSLTSIMIPNNVMSIGAAAFSHCNNLTDIVITMGLRFISAYAFSSCSKLTNITIPDSVTEIGNMAFAGCSGLKSITIPNSVTTIGDGAFFGCSGLADKNGFVIVQNVLYNYFVKATNIIIPNGVISISGSAFYYCSSLKSITIPASVTSIGNRTFSGCINLRSITIPVGVTFIGDYAFYGCKELKIIYYAGNNKTIINELSQYADVINPSTREIIAKKIY